MDHISKHLKTAANPAPAPLETKRSETTDDEKSLALALEGVKIKFYSEEELKQVLRYVFMIVGIRGNNLPEGMDKEFLHAYIKDNYGGHTGPEIRLAFTMAIQGKLEIPSSEVTCYENFSVAYFTKIMNAFRAWSADAARHIKEEKKIPTQPIYSTNIIDNENRKLTEECYQRFLRGNMVYFPTAVMYPILVQDKVILPGSDVLVFFEDRKAKGITAIYERY